MAITLLTTWSTGLAFGRRRLSVVFITNLKWAALWDLILLKSVRRCAVSVIEKPAVWSALLLFKNEKLKANASAPERSNSHGEYRNKPNNYKRVV